MLFHFSMEFIVIIQISFFPAANIVVVTEFGRGGWGGRHQTLTESTGGFVYVLMLSIFSGLKLWIDTQLVSFLLFVHIIFIVRYILKFLMHYP